MPTATCSVTLTRHAECRMAQRGVGLDDLDLILEIGTDVEGGLLVLRRDAEVWAARRPSDRDRVRRLVGKRIVMAGDRVVTAYHASDAEVRRLVRSAPERQGRPRPPR